MDMGMREKIEDIMDAVERGGPPYSDKYLKAMAAIAAAMAEAEKVDEKIKWLDGGNKLLADTVKQRDADYQRAREAAVVLEICGLLSEYSDEALAIILAYFNPQPSSAEREEQNG